MYSKIFRRLLVPIGVLVVVASLIASCVPTTVTVEVPVKETVEVPVEVTSAPPAAGPVTIHFWTAPNPQQEAYWKDIVDDWNASNPDIQTVWEVIPAGASSEEVLLTAIATGTAPDISTNVFSGFAAQLVSSGALVSLDEEFSDFWDVVEGRQMRSILEGGWGYKGHYYVLPLYNNAMSYWWGKDLLAEAGMSEAPHTYSDVLALCQAVSKPDERYGIQYPGYQSWWNRWFGYLTLYYAASGGAPYLDLENNKVLFNNEAGRAVLNFMDETFRNGCAPTMDLSDPLQNGIIAGRVMGPWSINSIAETYPDFEYVVAPPPVPDDYPEGEPVYTFADTKGMVLFGQSQHKAEAWEFIKWYFADVQHDVDWLEVTNMPPVREDIATNPAFDAYWVDNPVVKEYAKGVPYSVPPALIPTTIEVQRIMGTQMIEPIWFGTKSPDDAMADAVKAIEDYLALGQ
jgi:multiple sugar transport system substrate-binding protein